MLIIRQEQPSDFRSVYELVKIAFQTAKVSDGNEQNFVNKLRASLNYIPELELVAEEDSKLVGHIMLTKTYVTMGNSKFDALLLAPLSVALEYRRRGIGSKLVSESFRLAKNLGHGIVFVVGNPAFYSRCGFTSSALFGIKHVPAIPDQFVMVHELFAGALSGITGIVTLT